MPNLSSAGCLDVDNLISYFEKTLDQEEERRIEEHLATCDTCVQSAGEVREVWRALDLWTAKNHAAVLGAIEQHALLGRALDQAAASPVAGKWHDRLLAWKSGSGGAARVAMRAATGLVTDGLQGLVSPDAVWRFAVTPEVARGDQESQQAGVRPRLSVSSMKAADNSELTVSFSRSDCVIAVTLEHYSRAQPPLALLIDVIGESSAVVQELTEISRDETGIEWNALFHVSPQREYIIAVEAPQSLKLDNGGALPKKSRGFLDGG